MSASANDYFMKTGMSTATTLSAPGYTIGDPTMNVGATTNYPTDTGFTYAVDEVDSEGKRISGTYNIFRGVVTGGTQISSVVYVGGDPPRDYTAGATTRVYLPVSNKRENRLVDGILVHANQDGTLKDNSVGTDQIQDDSITSDKVDFATLYSETIVLPTTISPLTTTYQSIGSITIPALSEPIKVQLIAKSHINHNGTGGVADYQMEIHNGTTSLDETIVSALGGSYLYNLTCIAKTTLNGGEVISVRIKRGTAGSGGAGGGRSKLSIFRIGS